jgi:hypothetical protein
VLHLDVEQVHTRAVLLNEQLNRGDSLSDTLLLRLKAAQFAIERVDDAIRREGRCEAW